MPELLTEKKDWTGLDYEGCQAKFVAEVVHTVVFPAHLLAECRTEKHLSVCLFQRVDRDEYVCWYFNHSDGGFHHGIYCSGSDAQKQAWLQFIGRVKRNLT